jgi:alpha-tubulin suppressor-like RCC1 family protein
VATRTATLAIVLLAASCASVPPDEPDAAPPLPRIVQVAAGGEHTCALVEDGTVRCWGNSAFGQLGYGSQRTIGDDETAAEAGVVPVGGQVTSIAVGELHTCALLVDGAVRCWGWSGNGQLGYGSRDSIGDDELAGSGGDIDLGGPATAIAAGAFHTCAVMQNKQLRCWGLGERGQLGLGSTAWIGDDELPSAVGPIDTGGDVEAVACGDTHTCALLSGGAVRCWGWGQDGRLGAGNLVSIGDTELPTAASPLSIGGVAEQVAASGGHSCARLTNDDVRCWGLNAYGQLGSSSTDNIGDDELPSEMAAVDIGSSVSQLSLGVFHSCAVSGQGDVYCWGRGEDGRLGYGSTAGIGDDEAPAGAGAVSVGGSATAISAGGAHTCALLDRGAVRCWGRAALGQLGYGTTSPVGDDEAPALLGDVPVFL